MNFTQKQHDDHQRRHGFAPSPSALTPVTNVCAASAARVQEKGERQLQASIYAYLTQHRQKDTVRGVINPPMHRRSLLPSGWPDFTFAYRGRPIALEAKMPGKDAEAHQAACHDRMRADGWLVWVVRSVDDVASALDAVDYMVETGR